MRDSTFEKYKLVIDEWFINGFNGTKAYQKYYPKINGDQAAVRFNEIVRISKMGEYLKSKQSEARETSSVTHQELTNDLLTIKLRCMQGEEVLDKQGNKTGEWRFDPQSAIKAIENLGKHTGYFEKDNSQKDKIIVVNG